MRITKKWLLIRSLNGSKDIGKDGLVYSLSRIYYPYLDGPCDLALEENSSKPVLWYDEYSKRFFTASLEQVLMAEYHLNRNYILRGEAVINELYEFLGLEPTDWGAEAGWAPMDEGMFWIEFNHIPAKLDDGSVFYIIEMPFEPTLNYDEYY